MNHCGTQRLETKRLVLRRLAASDAEAMFRNWTSDPEVTRFLTWPAHPDVNVTKYVLGTWLTQYEKQDYYHWAITLKEAGDEPIGTIHGLVNEDMEQVTIGYCLGKAWWHQGIMSEAAQAVIDFFFDQVRANSICSYHDPNNPHSGMVMKHCGLKFEGTRRSSDRNNTGICDISWYSILQTEYRSIAETERLIITELTVEMAQDVHENSLDEDTRRFIPDEVFETEQAARNAIEELMKQYQHMDGPLVYPVFTKNGNRNIGYVQLVPTGNGHWEIGYHIAKKHTGNGYATEAVRAFLRKMTERLAVNEVDGICLAENAASRRVLDKCGFAPVYEGQGDYQGKLQEVYKSIWKQE